MSPLPAAMNQEHPLFRLDLPLLEKVFAAPVILIEKDNGSPFALGVACMVAWRSPLGFGKFGHRD